ncbi:MAG TPA: hypothetical protein DIS94_04620 [Bacteroidetes bacterium]|nr:hypothetical protein [Bacteroidota bacterium]
MHKWFRGQLISRSPLQETPAGGRWFGVGRKREIAEQVRNDSRWNASTSQIDKYGKRKYKRKKIFYESYTFLI